MSNSSDLLHLKQQLRAFAEQRNWDQFHTPKNLSMALSGEVAEITEIFQWLTPEQSEQLSIEKKQQLEEEIADVMMYLVRLADKCDIDISDACQRKLAKNNEKYPVDKCYGSAKKYNES
ncbi:nucleotide pyrophosphohydrolase [Photobacterium leiognathi]|uniref:nucleotide pyrophosphohydrolase n=1 Tax=Photobacterium leiognathi TaxID=553611 RepID=UPI0029826AE3|nr:nucleotide pyrophosphohydrolase [Photobacterium leiognathi]